MFTANHYLVVLVLAYLQPGVLAAGNGDPSIQSTVTNPCLFKTPQGLAKPDIKRAFDGDDERYNFFNREYLASRTLALKHWLMSTETFRVARSPRDIEVQELKLPEESFEDPSRVEAGGTNNQGVYEVHLSVAPKMHYIVKIVSRKSEAKNLWRLQNSAVTHKECYAPFVPGNQDFPYFPRIVEAEWSENEIFSTFVMMLLEKAPGETMRAIRDKDIESDLLAEYMVGRSMAAFHYTLAANRDAPMSEWKTWIHGDLTFENVLFDRGAGRVSLIDIAGMKQGSAGEDIGDIIDLSDGFVAADYIYRKSEMELFRKNNYRGFPLNFYLYKFVGKKAAKENPAMKTGDALIAALENPSTKNDILKAAPILDFAVAVERLQSFARGYIEVLPQYQRPGVYEYFKGMCVRTITLLLKPYQFENLQGPHRLIKALKSTLPPVLFECAETGKIDGLRR